MYGWGYPSPHPAALSPQISTQTPAMMGLGLGLVPVAGEYRPNTQPPKMIFVTRYKPVLSWQYRFKYARLRA